MFRFVLGLCLVGLALSTPPVTRSRQDIEEFKNFLEAKRRSQNVVIQSPVEAEWQTSGKFEGDIFLDEFLVDQLVSSYSAGRNAYTWPNTKWPENTVIWEFGEGEFNDGQKAAIEAGIKDIENRTCIRFRQRQGERVFVRVTGGPGGCYASIGYWQSRGEHTFNVARNNPGFGCLSHTTIIHEWLHVIGFLHMQSTHDRDEYVTVQWNNIQPGMEHNFEKYTNDLVSNLDLPYEYTSSMHYHAYGFSINGEPTLVPTQEFEGEMGQGDYITDNDYLRVNRHYNCPGAWD